MLDKKSDLAGPGIGTYELRLRANRDTYTHIDRKIFGIRLAPAQARWPKPQEKIDRHAMLARNLRRDVEILTTRGSGICGQNRITPGDCVAWRQPHRVRVLLRCPGIQDTGLALEKLLPALG